MGFKFVILWTDVALWALFASLIGYAWRVSRHDTLRATWRRVLRDAPALCSSMLLLLFVGVTALDSVHFRRGLAASVGQPAGQQFFDTRTESLLDLALEHFTLVGINRVPFVDRHHDRTPAFQDVAGDVRVLLANAERGIKHLLVVPCMFLTFMFGPVGLMLYVGLRAALGARAMKAA
jgi:hypothetical protein